MSQAIDPPVTALFDLRGKVAVVTGASRGIGRSIAERLAALGARVVVSSRRQEACDAVVADIKANHAAAGGDAMALTCNIGYRDQCEALIDRTIETWGRVDILVLNAAMNPWLGRIGDMPDWAWEKTWTANVRSCVWLSDRACRDMATRGDGAVVVIGSTSGLRGSETTALYAMTKAADMQLVRNITVEWGRRGIRANCVAPSLVVTDMAEALWSDPKRQATVRLTYPLGRLGRPEDVSGIAVAPCTRAGAWITGQTILVDGGMMAASGRFS